MNPVSRLTTTTVAARIPYANAAPFYGLWGDAPFAVRNLVPRELGREAEAGTVDLGLMAAADYLRLKDRFELVRANDLVEEEKQLRADATSSFLIAATSARSAADSERSSA